MRISISVLKQVPKMCKISLWIKINSLKKKKDLLGYYFLKSDHPQENKWSYS